LGEFSPIEKFFTKESFCKFSKIAQIFGLPNFSVVGKSYESTLTKNRLGHILGDFFSNSSDHPAPDQQTLAFCVV
jgi:hypothetical protein